MRNGLMKPGTQVTSIYQVSQAILNDKDDGEQGQSSLAPIDTEAPISQQVQNDEEFPQDQFMTASSSQQKSMVLVSPPSAAEQSLASASASSTKATSIQNLASSHTSARQISETITEIEYLFATMGQLVRPCPVPYSQPGSSANTHAESYESDVGSSESYVYSMGLIKKVLMKPLMEVPRSPDGLVLLATMKNLKKSGLLNSQQLEIIQAYVDNFDSLVSSHPLYEHQTDRTSALKCSIEDKRERVSDLKNHHGDLINNASSLAEEREALKKRLDEIAEEEIHIRDLRTQLISWKAELETYMKALPEALRQQNEAENRANNSNDHWGNILSLFA